MVDLQKFVVVLCRVEGSVNVGAICRAMKSMGLSKLIFANCPKYNDIDVRTYSLQAYDIFENALRYDTLREALLDFSLIAGLTRRTGQKRKEHILLEDFSKNCCQNMLSDDYGKVALVFGNEKNGLSDYELEYCDEAVKIDTSDLFPSLNVSHAVQIVCWEIRKAFLSVSRKNNINSGRLSASRAEQEFYIDQIIAALENNGFFKLAGKAEMKEFFRTISSRAFMSKNELNRLSSVFKKNTVLANKKKSVDNLLINSGSKIGEDL